MWRLFFAIAFVTTGKITVAPLVAGVIPPMVAATLVYRRRSATTVCHEESSSAPQSSELVSGFSL